MNLMKKLTGKNALVTGGSNGIGAATVRALASEGARVAIGYHLGMERAQALCNSLSGEGHFIVPMALEDCATHKVLATTLASKIDRLDILVNSAGYTQRIKHDDLEALDSALFNQILLANVGGVYSVTRELMPLLRTSGDAVVINISSAAAISGAGSNIAYGAAKAATDTMTISLARSGGKGIRFVCVSPGSVDTDFVPGRTRVELEQKAAKTPLGRVVVPEDVAMAVLAFATHLKAVTGVRLVVDGGQLL
jgi:3-oxoacyl-[acyl-carrier protein] reductase